MEALLFDSYRAFQKEYKGSVLKCFLKMPLLAKILFVIALVSVIISIACIGFRLTFLSYISIVVELLMCIILSFYVESFQIKTADTRLSRYEIYCKDVYDWLGSTGYVASAPNIAILKCRVERQIQQKETLDAKKKESIGRIITVFLIPLLLALYSLWMEENTGVNELIGAALSLIIFAGCLGGGAYMIYLVLSFYSKQRFEQLKCFAADLQGILDTQFEDKLISLSLEE